MVPDDRPRSSHLGQVPALTTDSSEVAISAVLTQPDDEGHHHRQPMRAEPSPRPRSAVGGSCPARIPPLGSGAPRLPVVLLDLTLRNDSQELSWLRTMLYISHFFARSGAVSPWATSCHCIVTPNLTQAERHSLAADFAAALQREAQLDLLRAHIEECCR